MTPEEAYCRLLDGTLKKERGNYETTMGGASVSDDSDQMDFFEEGTK